MELYANARLQIVEKQNFSDDQGQTVEFFINYLKNEDGGVLKVNSKADYSQFEGKFGIVRIAVREQDRGVKLSLRGFTPDESFELPEEPPVE